MRGAVTLAALGAGLYLVMRDDQGQTPANGTPEYVESGELLEMLIPGATQKDDPLFQGQDTPRGIRNNNPGNIEKGDPWRGLAEDQSQDSRFAVFRAPVWGIRALARTLGTYREHYGLDTVQGIIERWAPPHENNTGAYVQAVADAARVAPSDPLPEDDDVTARIVKAMIHHENGIQPYPDDLIHRGIDLA